MTKLPADIENKIEHLFTSTEEKAEVKKLLITLWQKSLNVGPDQLARSILFLSEGKLDKLKAVFEKDFYGDPRDVIMMAEEKAGSPKHYFIPPFDKIDK